MCGLVGLVLKTNSGGLSSDVALFNDLLYIDALRGKDSTGVMSFHSNGELRVLKEATEASSFMTEKIYEDLGKEFVKNGKVLIGHNRKKTIGKLSDETAHPFVLENRYAFMHNGTLRNHEKLYKTEVDSEALGMHLTKCEGDKEAIEEALKDVDGAYACMWIDQHKEKLYLLRNSERPLFLATTSIGYVIASEYGFIAAACLRNRLDFKDCKQLETDTLYSIDLSSHLIPMVEEKLTVKKSITLPINTGKKGGKACTTGVSKLEEGEVSKNLFKRIRKQFLGSIVGFFIDDYLPRIVGNVASNDWLVWGQSEDIQFEHKFQGYLKNVTEGDLLDKFDSIPVSGRIDDVLYDQRTKGVIFQVVGLNPIAPSKMVVH